jgi:phage gpG-like protein
MSNSRFYQGVRSVQHTMKGIARRSQNMAPAWRKIGSYLSRKVRRQFATRGAEFGTPWAPLKPATRKQKQRLGYPRNPLVRTRELKDSFTGRPMNIERYSAQSATWGSGLAKAGWQHRGTRVRNVAFWGRPAGTRIIPPRPILVVTPQMQDEMGEIVNDYIAGNLRRKRART